MALKNWTGGAGDGNIATAGNWQGGVALANGDTAMFDNSESDINAGLDLSAGATNLSLIFGPNWKGKIGRSTGALKLNDSTGAIRVKSPNAGGMYIECKSSGGMGDVEVAACGQGTNLFQIVGGIARMNVSGIGAVKLGPTAALTDPLVVSGRSTVQIESGASLSIRQLGGLIDNYAALVDYFGEGGQLNHWGSVAGNTGSVSGVMETRPGNLIKWMAARQNAGFTVAKLRMLGGTFDAGEIAAANTLTLLELATGLCLLNPLWTVTTRKILLANAVANYTGPTPATDIPMAIYGR